MKLKEIMTRNPEVIRPDTTVIDAAKKMSSLDVGFLPVGDGDNVIGVVTDRDIAIRAIGEGRDPKQTTVETIMTKNPESLPEDAGVDEAAKLMEKNQIRRIVVTGAKGKCVGVVSLGDMCLKLRDEHMTSEILEKVSEPAHS